MRQAGSFYARLFRIFVLLPLREEVSNDRPVSRTEQTLRLWVGCAGRKQQGDHRSSHRQGHEALYIDEFQNLLHKITPFL